MKTFHCYDIGNSIVLTSHHLCDLQAVGSFFWRFRDPIRVPRIENRVPRIRENCHRVPRIRENRIPRIRQIVSLQIHTGYLTFSLKKPCALGKIALKMCGPQQDFVTRNICQETSADMQGQQNHVQNQIALNTFGSTRIDFGFERTTETKYQCSQC